ncbi:MAG: prolipoprotein diacylglyceryl transferase [Anaerolineae bacterium]|nr:prolipoprotein diacylglyceryl transferase [Anaerolineae bacterium]
MFPFLTLGPWRISTYYLVAIAALLAGAPWIFYRLRKLNRPPITAAMAMFLTFIGGFAGSALTTALINALHVASGGSLAAQEQLSMSRAVMCGIAVAAALCWKYRVSLGRALDLAAPPVLLGLAIARIGCFANGCCYGQPTDSWLGMFLPNLAGLWERRYPTQLMSAAANLAIFGLLVAVERYGMRRRACETGAKENGWPFDGFIALLGIALYSLKRFSIAFLREGGIVPILGPLSLLHLEALAGLAIAAVLIGINFYRMKKEAT